MQVKYELNRKEEKGEKDVECNEKQIIEWAEENIKVLQEDMRKEQKEKLKNKKTIQ